MKKVTTNITFGQILFILANFFVASFIFFYLGAKFGPDVLNLEDNSHTMAGLLPDEKFAEEVKVLLQNKKHDFMFDSVLSGKNGMPAVIEEPKPIVQQITPPVKVEKTAAVEVATVKTTDTKFIPLVKKGDEPQKIVATITTERIPDTVVPVPEETPAALLDEEVVPVASFSLQIGSYAEKKVAANALSIWQKRGFDARVVSYDIKGKGTWYRLELGSYSSEDQALNSQQNIMTQYKQSARVIQR